MQNQEINKKTIPENINILPIQKETKDNLSDLKENFRLTKLLENDNYGTGLDSIFKKHLNIEKKEQEVA